MGKRDDMWNALEGSFDLLVVGGGITGAGIARDATRRGLRVAVVEMNDFAFGTSSRSSKLVHGGLRYLEHYEFSLVFEAVSERRILQDIAPHLVNPLGFLFPVYKGQRHQLWLINAGMWLYDGLALFRSPKRHRNLKPKEVEGIEPSVKQEALKGAPLYFDCATDDTRLTLETTLDAARHGAVVCSYAKATGFITDKNNRITGVEVRDEVLGSIKKVSARTVVNATGPWTDRTIELGGNHPSPLLRPTKGVHVVVDHRKLPLTHAVVCFHPTDERVLFAIPWGDRTYLGTTDTDYEGDPAEVHATLADVDYLIDASNSYFPSRLLSRADVICTWAGIRPLMAPPNPKNELGASAVSREHQIVVGQNGLITIAGGKLTTYRRMAAEVVDTAVRLLELSGSSQDLRDPRTAKDPLPGAIGWPDDDDHAAVAERIAALLSPPLDLDIARNLADTYGMRGLELATLCVDAPELRQRLVPGRPEILAQIDWAVSEELATRVADVMIRRTQLFFRDMDQGLGACEQVAARMGELLGWDDERLKGELAAYRREVSVSRAWKAESATVSPAQTHA